MTARISRWPLGCNLACSAAINIALLLLLCLNPIKPIRKSSPVMGSTHLTHVTFYKPNKTSAAGKLFRTAKVAAVSAILKDAKPAHPTRPEVSSLAKSSTLEAPKPLGPVLPAHAVSATPGTARWNLLAANGRDLDLAIIAEDSLPVLRSFGVNLAFDPRRPRGTSFLFSLTDGQLHRAAVPSDYIVRELQNMPPEFDPVLERVEQALGASPHVYALYPPELYGAIRSMTLEALQEKRIPVTEETRAHIRMQLGRDGSFSVTLLSW